MKRIWKEMMIFTGAMLYLAFLIGAYVAVTAGMLLAIKEILESGILE
tara:strand:- start:608 stop:748 length:141 start_codon:yes stop_codon:yes gene_type:complete